MPATHSGNYSSLRHHGYAGRRYPRLLNYNHIMMLVGLACGYVLGMIYVAKGEEMKWVLLLMAGTLFPILVAVMQSLRKPLFMALMFTLCTQMEWNPWYAEHYGQVTPGAPMTMTLIMLILLLGMWFFNIYRGISQIDFFPVVTIPFFLVTLWAGMSSIVAVHPEKTFEWYPHVVTAFLIFLYLANAMRTHEEYRLGILAIAGMVAFSGLVGVLQFLKGGPLGLYALGELDFLTIHHGQARIAGLLGHPNGYGQLMSAFLPVLLVSVLVFDELGKKLRLICLGALGIGLLALILSFSRGAWIGLVLSMMYVMAAFPLSPRFRQHARGLFKRMVVLGLLGLLAISPLAPKIIKRFTGDDGDSAYSRIPLALMAMRVIKDNPITGVGLGNYKYAVDSYKPNKDYYTKDGVPFAVHNMTLYITAELGLPVLAMYLWIVGYLLIRGFQTAWHPDKYRSLVGMTMAGSLISILFSSQFEDVPLGDPRFVVFSALAGMVLGATQREPVSRPSPPRQNQ